MSPGAWFLAGAGVCGLLVLGWKVAWYLIGVSMGNPRGDRWH